MTRDLNQNFVKANIPNFNSNIMQDTNQVYVTTTEVISSGFCIPELARVIDLEK